MFISERFIEEWKTVVKYGGGITAVIGANIGAQKLNKHVMDKKKERMRNNPEYQKMIHGYMQAKARKSAITQLKKKGYNVSV